MITNLLVLSINFITNITPMKVESVPFPEGMATYTVFCGKITERSTNIFQITTFGFIDKNKTNICGTLQIEKK